MGRTGCAYPAARGSPDRHLKVSVGYVDSYIGEGQISYAGPGALARGRLALEIVRERLELTGVATSELRFELIGVDSLHGAAAVGARRRALRGARARRRPHRKRCARRCGSATRSKRSTPTDRPAAAAPSSRRASVIAVASVAAAARTGEPRSSFVGRDA